MNDKHFRQISKKEAFSIIGLHPKDTKTYYIDNFIIVVEDGGLSITNINGKDFATPESTLHTVFGFRYTKNGIDYLIKNKNNDLVIYEKFVEIVNS